jgi:hypothetical protein
MAAFIEKKGIGVNPQSQIHYTDHLAVVCIIMEIPLLFIDEMDYAFGKKYYPGLKTIKIDYQDFQPSYLIDNYEILFFSDLWDRHTLHEKFGHLEKERGKFLRHVHCPHGFSDKAFYLQKCINEDIVLIYGQNMLDMLNETGVFGSLPYYVMSGNYRYTYYKQHQVFFNKIIQEEVLSHFDQPRPVILYAPTWLDLEESTSFFEAYRYLLDHLPSEYNMIVKLHPRLELDDTVLYYQIMGKYEGRSNVLFLKDFPLVYPLLAHTDIYIGDMSSVGYDYLAFNRPMFFLNKQKRNSKTDRGLFLFKCGTEILPEEYSQIYKIIGANRDTDDEVFGKIRSETYNYTFVAERSFQEIKVDIIKAYNKVYIE